MSERYLLQGKPYIDPRANAQWSFPAIPVAGKDLHISISGGYGVTTKMPTLDYLYPDLWYNDNCVVFSFHTGNCTRAVYMTAYNMASQPGLQAERPFQIHTAALRQRTQFTSPHGFCHHI